MEENKQRPQIEEIYYQSQPTTIIKKLEEELNDKTNRISIYGENNNTLRERVAEIKERINEINKLS